MINMIILTWGYRANTVVAEFLCVRLTNNYELYTMLLVDTWIVYVKMRNDIPVSTTSELTERNGKS